MEKQDYYYYIENNKESVQLGKGEGEVVGTGADMTWPLFQMLADVWGWGRASTLFLHIGSGPGASEPLAYHPYTTQ